MNTCMHQRHRSGGRCVCGAQRYDRDGTHERDPESEWGRPGQSGEFAGHEVEMGAGDRTEFSLELDGFSNGPDGVVPRSQTYVLRLSICVSVPELERIRDLINMELSDRYGEPADG